MNSLVKNNRIKLLINLGPLKKGGGHNVALNFLYELIKVDNHEFDMYFVVCERTAISDVLHESKWKNKIFVVSSNPIKRICQEFTLINKYIKNNGIDIVFTYFGFAFLGKGVKQVIGSADSNLYFPEIDFWKNEKRLNKIRRFLVDQYRVYGIKAASGVIFENKAMYNRASNLFKIRNKKLIYPSISFSEQQEFCGLGDKESKVRLLFLCGWQRNKNILKIPEIINGFRKNGRDVEVIISTEPDDSSCANEFLDKVKYYNVQESIVFLGTIKKEQLHDLYNKIDFVFLLSLLESFSNNIIEAWHYRKPLIISDEVWSRSICDDAAVYVERDNTKQIVEKTIQLLDNIELIQKVVDNGILKLSSYPTIYSRVNQELQFIKEVAI